MTNFRDPLAWWRCSPRRLTVPRSGQLWTRVLGWGDCPISVSRFTLRFLDPSLERGFAKRRVDRNVKSGVTLSVVMTVTTVIVVGSAWYRVGTPADPVAAMHWGILGAVICIGLLQAIIFSIPPIVGKMSPLWFEVYGAVQTVLMFIAAALFSPHYGGRLIGHDLGDICDVSGPLVGTDTRPLLIMQLALLGSHFVLVIRWHVLFVTELMPVLIYVALASTVGSPRGDDPAENLVALGCATLVISLGKRVMEYNERMLFLNLIEEQCLRCNSEFQLAQLRGDVNTMLEEVLSTVDSRPETTESGRAFVPCPVDGELGPGVLKKVQSVGQREQWLISSEELTVNTHKVLGSGTFGTVVTGRYLGTAVAIKTPNTPPEGRVGNQYLLQLCNELRIMRRLRHPNIVTFFGANLVTETYSLALVLELVCGVSLRTLVLHNGARAGGVPEDLQGELCSGKRLRLLLDIVCALRYLHSRMPKVVHGDLKDSNIFVEPWRNTKHGIRAKLLDFGLARILTQHSQPLGGTLRWQAPEITRSRIRPEASADIFSVGRLVYFTVTGREPFHTMTHNQLSEHFTGCQHSDMALQWPEQDWLSARAQPLVEECGRLEPEGRPGVDQVHAQLAGWLKEHKRQELAPPTGSRGHGCANRKPCSWRLPSSSTLPTILENSQLLAPGDGGPQMTRPGFVGTPRKTQKLLLSWALRGCHLPVPPGGCCAFHAGLQAWAELLEPEADDICLNGLQDAMRGQCPACRCLLREPPGQGVTAGADHVCEVCSGCPHLVWEQAATACSPRFGAQHAAFAPTPNETQCLAVREILLRTNLAMSPGDCCMRHVCSRNLRGLLAELLCLPCHTLCAGDESPRQCAGCSLLLFGTGGDARSHCALCNISPQPNTEDASNRAHASGSTALSL